METIKLNFDADVLGKGRSITVELPYSDGIVATSRFCPMELLSGDIELLAALNGEPLEDFVRDCKLQLSFAKEANTQSSIHEAFIAGLMASVMENRARTGRLTMKDYLLHTDAFSYLIHAAGVDANQVSRMYPKVLESIVNTIDTDS